MVMMRGSMVVMLTNGLMIEMMCWMGSLTGFGRKICLHPVDVICFLYHGAIDRPSLLIF